MWYLNTFIHSTVWPCSALLSGRSISMVIFHIQLNIREESFFDTFTFTFIGAFLSFSPSHAHAKTLFRHDFSFILLSHSLPLTLFFCFYMWNVQFHYPFTFSQSFAKHPWGRKKAREKSLFFIISSSASLFASGSVVRIFRSSNSNIFALQPYTLI